MITRMRRGPVAGAFVAVAGAGLAGLAAAPSSAAPKPAVQLASVSTRGVPANGDTWGPVVVSADGKYVAFQSDATNLVPGDTNVVGDVFVRDLTRGLTRRANLDTAGEQMIGHGAGVEGLSGDGRYVLFNTYASNLVPDDTNERLDLFVRDMRYGITTRATLASDGSQIGNWSYGGDISGDGRYVVFHAHCGCVVPGDTNDRSDIFVRDLERGTTRRVSVASDGTEGNDHSDRPAISTDGRYVVFASRATNLVPADTNGLSDVFRHDLRTGVTIRVSVGPGGRQTSGGTPGAGGSASGTSFLASVSGNGRHVAFYSWAHGLVDGPRGQAGDVYVHDVRAGTTTLASSGLGGVPNDIPRGFNGLEPTLSGNGRYVGFISPATNLVPGDTNGVHDGFVRDLKTGITRRVTTGAGGQEGNARADWLGVVALDRDGDTAAFLSEASNLVAGDTNGRRDAFVARLR